MCTNTILVSECRSRWSLLLIHADAFFLLFAITFYWISKLILVSFYKRFTSVLFTLVMLMIAQVVNALFFLSLKWLESELSAAQSTQQLTRSWIIRVEQFHLEFEIQRFFFLNLNIHLNSQRVKNSYRSQTHKTRRDTFSTHWIVWWSQIASSREFWVAGVKNSI